jgi:hypothetical protein
LGIFPIYSSTDCWWTVDPLRSTSSLAEGDIWKKVVLLRCRLVRARRFRRGRSRSNSMLSSTVVAVIAVLSCLTSCSSGEVVEYKTGDAIVLEGGSRDPLSFAPTLHCYAPCVVLLNHTFRFYIKYLKWLYHKEDNHLLIFCVFSRDCSSNISQKYKLGNFWEYFKD